MTKITLALFTLMIAKRPTSRLTFPLITITSKGSHVVLPYQAIVP
jgi:hypothetical protein